MMKMPTKYFVLLKKGRQYFLSFFEKILLITRLDYVDKLCNFAINLLYQNNGLLEYYIFYREPFFNHVV